MDIRELDGGKIIEIIKHPPTADISELPKWALKNLHTKYDVIVEKDSVKLKLSFDGILRETPYNPVLNKTIIFTSLQRSLGFINLCQIRVERLDESKYSQLHISMELDPTNENKSELSCAFKNYKITKI